MTALMNIAIFVLLTVLLITIGNLVFSIGELKEHTDKDKSKKRKNTSISIIKMTMYALTKLVIFALVINLLMFEFYDKSFISRLAQFVMFFVMMQIVSESVSLNHMMRLTVKSLNKFSTGDLELREYFEKISPYAFRSAISGKNKIMWALSLSANIITIVLSVYLYSIGIRTLFFQNLIIYFVVLMYIKYHVLKLIKQVAKSNQ
jgi:hypothetical protein